jgi:hypothetical protein
MRLRPTRMISEPMQSFLSPIVQWMKATIESIYL